MTTTYYDNLSEEHKSYVQKPDHEDSIGKYSFAIVSEM